MTNSGDRTDAPDFIVRDEIDELFGHASPNPERIGCPPREVLSELVNRVRPLDDPAYEHLGHCSPCYREFTALLEKPAAVDARSRLARLRWIAAAVVIVLAATGLWFFLQSRRPSPEPVQAGRDVPLPATVRATVDLRPFAVARSPQDPSAPAPLVLPRARFVATISLPVGAEAGPYEVQVRDPSSRALTSAAGDARMVNFVATLEAVFDLSAASPGTYQLAIRRDGDEWRLFPAIVH